MISSMRVQVSTTLRTSPTLSLRSHERGLKACRSPCILRVNACPFSWHAFWNASGFSCSVGTIIHNSGITPYTSCSHRRSTGGDRRPSGQRSATSSSSALSATPVSPARNLSPVPWSTRILNGKGPLSLISTVASYSFQLSRS